LIRKTDEEPAANPTSLIRKALLLVLRTMILLVELVMVEKTVSKLKVSTEKDNR